MNQPRKSPYNMAFTSTALMKYALRLCLILIISIEFGEVNGQPIQGGACTDCGVQSCFCCDGADPGCDCIPEDPLDIDVTCGTPGSADELYADLVCAADVGEAEQFCNNQYNPIPLTKTGVLILLGGILSVGFFRKLFYAV